MYILVFFHILMISVSWYVAFWIEGLAWSVTPGDFELLRSVPGDVQFQLPISLIGDLKQQVVFFFFLCVLDLEGSIPFKLAVCSKETMKKGLDLFKTEEEIDWYVLRLGNDYMVATDAFWNLCFIWSWYHGLPIIHHASMVDIAADLNMGKFEKSLAIRINKSPPEPFGKRQIGRQNLQIVRSHGCSSTRSHGQGGRWYAVVSNI